MNCPVCGERIRIPTYDGRCAECGTEYLQPWAVKCLARWTFTTWPDASGRVPREGPTEGLWTNGKRGPYLFACKNYKRSENGLYKGRYASFSATLIGSALTNDRKLALFVGPGPYSIEDAYVFDARRVANQATERERATVDSKRERDVPIFDVSARAHGVGLGDYLAERKRLPGPAETRPTTLRTFGIERGEV